MRVTEETHWHSVQEAISPASGKRLLSLGNLFHQGGSQRSPPFSWARCSFKSSVRSVCIREGLEVLMTLLPTCEPGISLAGGCGHRVRGRARRPSLGRGECSQQAITRSPARSGGLFIGEEQSTSGEESSLKTPLTRPLLFPSLPKIHCTCKPPGGEHALLPLHLWLHLQPPRTRAEAPCLSHPS